MDRGGETSEGPGLASLCICLSVFLSGDDGDDGDGGDGDDGDGGDGGDDGDDGDGDGDDESAISCQILARISQEASQRAISTS